MRRHANPEYRRIITGKRWIALRTLKMQKNAIENGGFCEACVRKYRPGDPRPRKATEVHHITPIESGHTREEMEALAYNENNLMALCSECHRETHRLLGKAHLSHLSLPKHDKESIRQALENDINDYINKIKNGE